MIPFPLAIDKRTVTFLHALLSRASLAEANTTLQECCGIHSFFHSEEAFNGLKTGLENSKAEEQHKGDRRAYGDFQTNSDLASTIVQRIKEKQGYPEFILEPTCGTGTFLLEAIRQFPSAKKLVGIEIYEPYIWASKFKILEYFLKHPQAEKPDIELIQANIFEFNIEALAKSTRQLTTLIIGNPPWVTNAELSRLQIQNLPKKSNYKKHRGLDALTGMGNFDIAEAITTLLLQHFDQHEGYFAFLVKNTVVKNLLRQQKRSLFAIGQCQKFIIDAKREFNATVDACLFQSKLHAGPNLTCQELDFYSQETKRTFGWEAAAFVYSAEIYQNGKAIEGRSPLEWRQGLKHDCAKVMELVEEEGYFLNGFGKKTILEQDLIYGLLKGSDLKTVEIKIARKSIILTQKKLGEATDYIQSKLPKTYAYLNAHRAYFERRKSSIYKGKPAFSIFGIGPYAFAPYKVAIAGLYKRSTFSLLHPVGDKAPMLDDTCYYLGFEQLQEAQMVQHLLHSEPAQQFLKAIIFPDSKRPITKEVLMRIDLGKLFQLLEDDLDDSTIAGISKKEWQQFATERLY